MGLHPIEEGLPLLTGKVAGKEPVSHMQAADQDCWAALVAEPHRVGLVHGDHARQVGRHTFELRLHGLAAVGKSGAHLPAAHLVGHEPHAPGLAAVVKAPKLHRAAIGSRKGGIEGNLAERVLIRASRLHAQFVTVPLLDPGWGCGRRTAGRRRWWLNRRNRSLSDRLRLRRSSRVVIHRFRARIGRSGERLAGQRCARQDRKHPDSQPPRTHGSLSQKQACGTTDGRGSVAHLHGPYPSRGGAACSTRTQSLPACSSPGGSNVRWPLFSNSPSGVLWPVRGSNHQARTFSPGILPN